MLDRWYLMVGGSLREVVTHGFGICSHLAWKHEIGSAGADLRPGSVSFEAWYTDSDRQSVTRGYMKEPPKTC